MKKFLFALIIMISFQQLTAQNSSAKIYMKKSNWKLPDEARFERFDNRETLVLKSGRATVDDQKFSNGSIEVDVYANSKRSFAGITFRKQKDHMEEVYMRMHKSNQVDAVQYTPIFNGESNWQLFREYQARVSFKETGWNTLRVDVNNKSATVYVNDEKVLSIDHLRTENTRGDIGLFALFTNRFSNFRVTHKDQNENKIVEEESLSDPGIINTWEITKAHPYKEGKVLFENFSNEKYTTVATESSGLLTISKYVKKTASGNFEQNSEDYIVARTSIHADRNELKTLSFDYSDKIIVFLNGNRIFEGNNAFRTKGVQYMGHVDISTNKLFLPFKKGENEIHCVVIDKANGWGLIGKLE